MHSLFCYNFTNFDFLVTSAICFSSTFNFLIAASFLFGFNVPSESLSGEPSCFELQKRVGNNIWNGRKGDCCVVMILEINKYIKIYIYK